RLPVREPGQLGRLRGGVGLLLRGDLGRGDQPLPRIVSVAEEAAGGRERVDGDARERHAEGGEKGDAGRGHGGLVGNAATRPSLHGAGGRRAVRRGGQRNDL